MLDYLMPAGASLAETNRVLVGVEKMLHSIPEVQSTSRRTGLQLGLAAVTEANTGDISVLLKSHRSRGVEEVISEVRDKINASYPQLDTDFHQVLEDMIGDLTSSPDPIEIKLFSENFELLKTWGPRVGDAIKSISSVKDVKNGIEDTISGPAITFNVDQGIAARAGFTPQEIELDASAIFQGEPAPVPVIVNARPYTLRVTFPPSTRSSLDAIRNTLLVSGTGKIATLGTLATIENDPGQIGDPPRKSATRYYGNRPVRRRQPGYRHCLSPEESRHPASTFFYSRRVRRPISAAAAVVPRSPLRACRGYRARVYRVAS